MTFVTGLILGLIIGGGIAWMGLTMVQLDEHVDAPLCTECPECAKADYIQ